MTSKPTKTTSTAITEQGDINPSGKPKDSITALRAVPMSVFPTLTSLDEAMNTAIAATPVVSKNEMRTLIMTYHNTLLAEVTKNK
jgi:hypothetical protein